MNKNEHERVIIVVIAGVIIFGLVLLEMNRHVNELIISDYKPEDSTSYVSHNVSTASASSNSSNAIIVGGDAVSSSNGEAIVYGTWLPKNVSITPYLDDNDKLQVKLEETK